ncbi:MAG: glutathione S-transferase N-terminal domain-containing protein [Actinomycetes bacterium]
MDKPVLYAMRSSLYSSKARSYLLKQGIEHLERPPGDPRYASEIMPHTGRWILPVLKTAEGEVIQDTVDITDHFDSLMPPERAAHPPVGAHAVLAHVFEMFGSEGLMRPALHFRWNFDEQNMPFVGEDFGRGLVLPGGANTFESTSFDVDLADGVVDVKETRAGISKFAADRMRALTIDFGVNPETIPEIERSYSEFLALFSAHLEVSPYLLGGRPTLGDFAFMGPLYAHLSRDPYPSAIMKREAWPVWRWVERMNSPIPDTGEYGETSTALFPDNGINRTLTDLLAYMGREFADEVVAHMNFIDGYLSEHPDLTEGDIVGGKATRRTLGMVTWDWHDHEVTTHAIPYRILHLQRIQEDFSALSDQDQSELRSIMRDAGLEVLLDIKARRRLARADNREVWGAEQDAVLPG